LKFSTASTRVPAGGFINLRFPFTIKRKSEKEADKMGLMLAHSCFSEIELPDYSSYELLARQVGMSIEEGNSFEIE
jgi:E3 ubiquitin-protein ligase HUWE1